MMTPAPFPASSVDEHTPIIHLRRGGTSVVIDPNGGKLPVIVHWGADLGPASQEQLVSLAVAARPQRVSGALDIPARLTVLPLSADGWQAEPALEGIRLHSPDVTPDFSDARITSAEATATVEAVDGNSGLSLMVTMQIGATGVLEQQATLTNVGATDYLLTSLSLTFPLPPTARELLDTTGRHLKERSPQRHPFTIGDHRRESRRGRPGADATLLLNAGETGFGFRRGMVHGIHVAWSGNHRLDAVRTPSGDAYLCGSELLLPGEIRLAPEDRYETPWIHGSWGHGLDELASRFHEALRQRPHHPRSPRPVTLNTWEAVYFDHDFDRLAALADKAATLGIERFVLDDGWFLGRRDDTRGLGDWYVDRSVWPQGLAPLIERVTGLGMQFGIWVEPEMVNPDSELARTHPDWILKPASRWPVPSRSQQVLNLANPEAFAYILERLDALLTEHDISYLKWDHNRDLIDAVDQVTGRPEVHATTTALYALIDEVKLRHPHVEIESCASGGARVDLGILERTDRIWVSDCIDAVERLDNQAFTNLLVPYELMGSHLGSPTSHSTRRTLSIGFQAGVALFGHFGIEWNVSNLDEETTSEVARWVSLYKTHRSLLHTGRSVRADTVDPSVDVRGVVSHDGESALFAVTQRHASVTNPVGRITLPGLTPEFSYHVEIIGPTSPSDGPGQSALEWATGTTTNMTKKTDRIILTGQMLESAGVQSPVLYPESSLLIHLKRVD